MGSGEGEEHDGNDMAPFGSRITLTELNWSGQQDRIPLIV